MVSLAQKIREVQVQPGCLGLFWIAQAGFVLKTPKGVVIYIDPYLTDYVQHAIPESGCAFKRVTPTLIQPEEVDADYVLSSHCHEDHFDAEAIPVIAKNPRVHFIGAPDCENLYLKAGVQKDKFSIFHVGEKLNLGDCQLTGLKADHGKDTPDALGFWFDIDGITVWFVGDSALRPDLWQPQIDQKVDILLPPINGAYGNLDGIEAARLAGIAHAKIVIPCHFWMFPMHLGSPIQFLDACKQYAPESTSLMLTQGEYFEYERKK